MYGPLGTLDRGLGGAIDGMLCQYRALPYFGLIKIPDHLSYEEAASLVCAGATAWNALYGSKPLVAGQTVLFQGTGGVSLCGLLFARAAGCTTIITSSSDEKLKEIKEKYGVDYTINYKTQPNWDEEAIKITNGRGVDIICDNGGAESIEKSLNAINLDGTIVLIGILDANQTLEISNFAFRVMMKSCILRGVLAGSRQQTEQLMNLIGEKKLKPPVTKIFNFDLKSIKSAYQFIQSQTHIGKICIKID